MECYLCKHCKAVTNSPITGLCEESQTGEHEWVSGAMVEDKVKMAWEREPDSLNSTSI